MRVDTLRFSFFLTCCLLLLLNVFLIFDDVFSNSFTMLKFVVGDFVEKFQGSSSV